MRGNVWKFVVVVGLAIAIVAVLTARSRTRARAGAAPPSAVTPAGPPPSASAHSAVRVTPVAPKPVAPPVSAARHTAVAPHKPKPQTQSAQASTAPREQTRLPASPKATEAPPTPPPPPEPTRLPQLIELGSKTCIPCKKMAPILEELRQQYAGRLDVIFYDIYERRDMAEAYVIRVIPTQVFLDGEGKEFFRHQGFYPKEDILARFREHGIELESK